MTNDTVSDNLSAGINAKPEKLSVLFKYLDAEGAKAMLANSNIQFTHATYLNDPFDCHTGLIVNSDDMAEITPQRLTQIAETGKYGYFAKEYRNLTYVCSLSKIFSSILMWSYYTKAHEGICLGIDMQKLKKYVPYIGFEVQYPDTMEKYDCTTGTNMKAFRYQLTTKAPDWKHEQEVRLLDSSFMYPNEKYRRHKIGGECFEAVYLGTNMSGENMGDIIVLARRLNPNIKIYQMTVNPDAFRLDYSQI